MKKTFASLVAALIATGLMAFYAPAATAGPYTGTVATESEASTKPIVKAARPVVVKYKLDAASNRTPKGEVVIEVFNRDGDRIRTTVFTYDPRQKKYSVGNLPKGRYTLVATFEPKPKSIFKRSRATASTRVV